MQEGRVSRLAEFQATYEPAAFFLPTTPDPLALSEEEATVLSCLDVEFDPLWGTVLTFANFKLEQSPPPLTFAAASRQDEVLSDPHAPGIVDDESCEAWTTRKGVSFERYCPSSFGGSRLRPISDFVAAEMITSLEKAQSLSVTSSAQEFEIVTLMCFSYVSFSGEECASAIATVTKCKNLQVLILRGVGLQFIDDLACSSLLYIDLSENRIADASAVLRLVSQCRALHTADFSGNPFFVHNSSMEDRIVAVCPSLHQLNRKPVDIQTKIRATEHWGDERSRCDIEEEIWDFQMNCNVAVRRLKYQSGAPSTLHRLDLSGCGLAVFHLGLFSNLYHLDLSDNRLRTLAGGGLEQLGRLRMLCVARNRLTAPDALLPLQALQSITYLSLSPQLSPDLLTSSSSYRLLVVMLTLDSAGSDARPGLNFLDFSAAPPTPQCLGSDPGQSSEWEWAPVTLSERLRAMRESGRCASGEDEEAERLRCVLVRKLGQHNTRSAVFMGALTSLSLCSESLSSVRLPLMPHLTSLDLSSNRIALLSGLDQLSNLRFLNLEHNPPLDSEAGARLLLTQLHPLTSLLAVSLPFSVDLHLRAAAAWDGSSAEHVVRMLVGGAAVQRINGRAVTIADRVRVFRQLGASQADAEQYLCDLAIAASVGRPANCACRRPSGSSLLLPGVVGEEERAHASEHHPACPVLAAHRSRPHELRAGPAYDPRLVLELPDLGGMGLCCSALRASLGAFRSLRRLNLAHNAIRSLLGAGVAGMVQLAVLDVSHNLIADELSALAALLDGLGELLVVCLRHNPGMRTPAQRRGLLARMTRTWDGRVLLRCLDSEITLPDRIAARQECLSRSAQGGASDAAEAGRTKVAAALSLCCRGGEDGARAAATVQELQLSGLGLGRWIVEREALARCEFEGLRALVLRGNMLAELGALCDASVLPGLEVLDLRANQLPHMAAVAQAARAHARLRELGVEDNPCAVAAAVSERQYKEARARLVGFLVEDGLGLAGSALRYIDDRAVEVEEVVRSWGSCGGDREAFRFEQNVVGEMRRQVEESAVEGGMAACEVLALRLSGRHLSVLDCSLFTALTLLDVSNNALSADALRVSGLHLLRQLEFLDVSANNIADPAPVAQAVRAGHRCAKLSSINVHSNPFFPSRNDSRDRVAFCALLPFLSRPGATLTALNGSAIAIGERVQALACNRPSPPSLQHDCRLALVLESLGASRYSAFLSLARQGLATLALLSSFSCLHTLVVCHNLLETLHPIPLLPLLSSLDIRFNCLPSTALLLSELTSADALRHLWIEGAAKDWHRWHLAHPFFWTEAFRALPGLLDCDDVVNPAPLSDFQWAAVLQLKATLGFGPNAIADVDVQGQGLGLEAFFELRDWLAFLPVRSLSVQGNPFCLSFPLYRFVLINDVQTLVRLNGSRISEPERANALKRVQELRASPAYYPPNVDSLKLETTAKTLRVPPTSAQRGSSAADYSSWGSKLETSLGFLQIHAFISSMPGVPWDSLPLYHELQWLLKPFILSVDSLLPQLQCLCFWGYLKAAFCILAPLLLARLMASGSDWSQWEYNIQHRLLRTVLFKLLQCMLLCAVGAGAAVALDCMDCGAMSSLRARVSGGVDVSTLSEREQICAPVSHVGACRAWRILLKGTGELTWVGGAGMAVSLCAVAGVWALAWMGLAGLVRWKNRKRRDDGFWFNLRRTRKKAAVVSITLLYLPVASFLLDNVRPFLPARTHDGMPARVKWGFATEGCIVRQGVASPECADYPASLDWLLDPGHFVFWLSAIFALLYILGIPVLLSRSIRSAVDAIDRNNPHVLIFAEAASLQEPWTARFERAWQRRGGAQGQRSGASAAMGARPEGAALPETDGDDGEAERERLRARCRRLWAEGNRKYMQAVAEFDDSRAALYCSYRWHWRYFKLASLRYWTAASCARGVQGPVLTARLVPASERVLLVACSIALSPAALAASLDPASLPAVSSHELHKGVAVVIVALFFIAVASARPFSDVQDGRIDAACRLTNVCNALVIFLAAKPVIFGHQTFTRDDPRPCPPQASISWITGPAEPSSNTEYLNSEDGYCLFLFRAGYALGAMNIACLVIVVVSLLISPIRWFLKKKQDPNGKEELDYRPVAKPAAFRSSSADEARNSEPVDGGSMVTTRVWRMLFGGRGGRKEENVVEGEGPRESLLCSAEEQQEEEATPRKRRAEQERADRDGAEGGMGPLCETREGRC